MRVFWTFTPKFCLRNPNACVRARVCGRSCFHMLLHTYASEAGRPSPKFAFDLQPHGSPSHSAGLPATPPPYVHLTDCMTLRGRFFESGWHEPLTSPPQYEVRVGFAQGGQATEGWGSRRQPPLPQIEGRGSGSHRCLKTVRICCRVPWLPVVAWTHFPSFPPCLTRLINTLVLWGRLDLGGLGSHKN